jgi:pyridoxal/pyridoxine/pyridoxamine kinase
MPIIEIIDGIRIKIYNRDHLPPHIHAVYNEFEAAITIENNRIIAGYLPENQLRKVMSWLTEHKVKAQKMFNDLNSFER